MKIILFNVKIIVLNYTT